MDGRGDLLRALQRTPGYVQVDDVGRLLSRSQEAVVSSAPPSRLRNWLWPFGREQERRVMEDAWSRGDCRWMPDEKCTKCFACGESFNSWTRRRHHCRLCGQIFCHNCCCNYVDGPVVGRSNEKKSRLCEACTEFVDDNLIDRSNMGRSIQETQETQETRDVEQAEAVPDDGVENDDDGPSDEEDTENRVDFGLDRDKEYLEHLYQPRDALEGKQEEHGAHADEWREMADAGFRRFMASVRAYCMEVGGLEEQDVFMICKLAQQVVKQMERPTQDDSMDILKYVKVKRVPGGSISDSKCYDGVVFSSDVVNRKMETDIDNCPLTLIQMPLTFDKYNVRTDLDALRDQEQIYLDLKVEKIVKDILPESPKLFICQAVVSQLALERLTKRGISVIIGVPEHILRAISRCTGSRVTPAVDSIRRTFPPSKENHIGGKAQRFYVSRVGYVGEEGYKALTFIEAAAGHKGKFSTVCLRGPTAKLAKPVLLWAIRLARHLQLESELLFELWCQPWQRELEKHGEEGDDLESLEITTYRITKKDLNCNPPEDYRFRAYTVPAAESPEAYRSIMGLRDCTVRQWLESSLQQPSTAPSSPQVSATAALSTEDAVLTAATAMDTVGVEPGAMPPLPECGKSLCFQRKGSRLVVELMDLRDEQSERGRARSLEPELRSSEGGAITRWSLLSQDKPADGRETERSEKSRQSGLTLEMWRFCRNCGQRGRLVTPRSALSESAGWHSMAKFLEILLHNTNLEYSPLAAGDDFTPCSHSSCEHVLCCGSPERPGFVISFKWEQVSVWRLRPPHLPFWDVDSGLLLEQDAKESTDSMISLFENMEKLIAYIRYFMRSVLICLSTIESEDQAESPAKLPAPRSESSLRVLRREGYQEEEETKFKDTNVLNYTMDLLSIRQWLFQNKATWHRVIKHLEEFLENISQRMKTANECLGRQGRPRMSLHAMKESLKDATEELADPVLVNTLRCDVLDAFRDSFNDKTTPKDSHQDLLNLQKLRMEEDKNKRGTQTSSFQISASLSGLLASAKDTLGRIWLPDELPEKSSDERSAAAVAEAQRLPRTSWTLDLDLTLESAKRESGRLEREPLPVHLDKVLKAFGDGLEESEKLQVNAGERCIYGICIPVNFDDPGSLIAHALLSDRAQEQMAAQWRLLPGGKPCCPLGTSCLRSLPKVLSQRTSKLGDRSLSERANQLVPNAPNLSKKELHAKTSKLLKPLSSQLSVPGELPGHAQAATDWQGQGLREVLTGATFKEVKVDLEDRQGKYSVCLHFAPQFHVLRHWMCGDDLNFVRSLQRCIVAKQTGGKSKATFYETHDKRFLLKALNKSEFDRLVSEAMSMFWYYDKVLFEKLPSVLTQVIGLFTVSATPKKKQQNNYTCHYVVQKNLRYRISNDASFDLKGVGAKRRMETPSVADEESPRPQRPGQTLWDQNFREWTQGKPLCLAKADLSYLEAAMFNDTMFLSNLQLMDYSLLLAAVPSESTPGMLFMGIIDYLRIYGGGEKLENVFKTATATLTQRDGEREAPTVVDPNSYGGRFMRAMSTYFVKDCAEVSEEEAEAEDGRQ